MLMRPLHWWDWEVVFVTGTLTHFWKDGIQGQLDETACSEKKQEFSSAM